MFVDGGYVAFLFVEELELEEGSEITWTGDEEFEQTLGRAHPFFLLIFLGGRRRRVEVNGCPEWTHASRTTCRSP